MNKIIVEIIIHTNYNKIKSIRTIKVMSFLDKLNNTKASVLLAVGGVALVGAFAYLYKTYNSENETELQVIEQQQQPAYDLDQEIEKIKAKVNLQNPSLEDIKIILIFSLEASKKEIFKFSKNFKKDRKKYDTQKRNNNLDQYLRMIAQGMQQIQQIGMSLQQQIMMKIGLSEHHFAKYQHQLGPFLQEQMMIQGTGSVSGKELSLDQVKKAINLQIDYMQNHGQEMVEKLVNTCGGWSQQEKGLVPTLLSVYIADEVFEEHPEIDEDDLQGAEMKFQHQLQNEMVRLQEVMSPIMRNLTEGLGFGGMGYGGGMDMGMGGGMDMMGGQGPTMEQLEQLRMQDPEAFEQLMYMMQQGMQR